MKSSPRLWTVVAHSSPPSELFDGFVLCEQSEWFRLWLGRSLALAQRGDHGWEFLVPGIPIESFRDAGLSSDQIREVARLVHRDFQELATAMTRLVKRAHEGGPPFGVMYGLVPLSLLRLPDRIDCWRVTDEGLSIVNWGGHDGFEVLGPRVTEAMSTLQRIRSLCLQKLETAYRDAGGEGSMLTGSIEPGVGTVSQDLAFMAKPSVAPTPQDQKTIPPAAGVLQVTRVSKRAPRIPRTLGWVLSGFAVVLLLVMTFMLGHKIGLASRESMPPTIEESPSTEPFKGEAPAPEPSERTSEQDVLTPEDEEGDSAEQNPEESEGDESSADRTSQEDPSSTEATAASGDQAGTSKTDDPDATVTSGPQEGSDGPKVDESKNGEA